MTTTQSAFLYIRITDKEQSTDLGEIQGRELAQWCTQNQIKNFQIFADRGASKNQDKRPAFKRMIEKVNAGECSTIVV